MKFAAAASLILVARVASADSFDDLVKSKMDEGHIPGLSFAVVYKDKVVMQRSYGLADKAKAVVATGDTRFQVASLSKPIIATAVMMLVEDGKCQLSDRIGKYVQGLPESWRLVPISNLLNQTSGLPEFRSGGTFFRSSRDELSFAQMISGLPTTKFEAGDHFEYSNTNYLLLGELISTVSKKPYTEFLRRRIFEPLGMTKTGFIGDGDACAVGYSMRSGYPVTSCSRSWAGPGASIVSTAEDYAKFLVAMSTPKLLRVASLNEMLKTIETRFGKSDYGLGWGLANLNGTDVALHSGKMNGFSSIAVRLLQPQISVVVLTNADDIDGNAIARGILGCYYPDLDAKKLTPIVDDEPEITEAHAKCLRQILSGHPDMSAFTENYKAHVSEEKLKVAGAQLARGGRLQPLKVLQRYRLNPRDISVYQASIGQTQLIVTFYLLDGKIDGLKFAAP